MKSTQLDLYTDYLLSNFGAATATGLSQMVDGAVSHDKETRFLSGRDYTSKDLWMQVKGVIRQVEDETGVLIFDDTIQEKMWTDESDLMCWHYDHCLGRTVKGINLLNQGCSLKNKMMIRHQSRYQYMIACMDGTRGKDGRCWTDSQN